MRGAKELGLVKETRAGHGGDGRRCSSVVWMGICFRGPRRGAFTPGSVRGREETEAKAAALLLAVKKEAAMIASLRHPNIILFMGEPPLWPPCSGTACRMLHQVPIWAAQCKKQAVRGKVAKKRIRKAEEHLRAMLSRRAAVAKCVHAPGRMRC